MENYRLAILKGLVSASPQLSHAQSVELSGATKERERKRKKGGVLLSFYFSPI